MKKIAAMVLAGVLAAVPVSTTGAAEFQDGADTQKFIWAAGEETSTDTDESKGVSANDFYGRAEEVYELNKSSV